MEPTAWRLLDTGVRSAAENMALDDVILTCRAKKLIPNTIRFLQFDPPAVLIGYHQSVEHEVRMDFVKNNGIDVNRRLTGGGAIYFDSSSLGWEIITKSTAFPHSQKEELFEAMSRGAIEALRMLGIQASFRPKNDIEVGGRKISGTGGTERDDAFLFQGTLLIDFDVETMIRALRIPIIKLKDKELDSAKRRVTCIRWELGHRPTTTQIKNTLKKAFERALGIKLVEDRLSSEEEELLSTLLPRYQSDDWLYLNRRPMNESATVHTVGKTPGGLIRVSLALDRGIKTIKSILVTGDFFVFPSNAVLDLEAALKFTSYDESVVQRIVGDFFENNGVQMPGVKPDGLVDLIMEAVDKTSYESLGISLEESNDLYRITKDAKKILEEGCDHLLLPYCAKLPSCEYRWSDGCTACGGCSTSDAYLSAERFGLKAITIVNFEHLMDTLRTLRQEGAKGFIGCCCEAFYCKHRDEMEEIGVPGIIIDIDDRTCYDLGREKEAYQGTFEGYTTLKTDLLSKLCRAASTKHLVRVGSE